MSAAPSTSGSDGKCRRLFVRLTQTLAARSICPRLASWLERCLLCQSCPVALLLLPDLLSICDLQHVYFFDSTIS